MARVVSEAEVQRWRWLREKRNLEKGQHYIRVGRALCSILTLHKIHRLFTVLWISVRHLSQNLLSWRPRPVGTGIVSVRSVPFHSVLFAGGHGECGTGLMHRDKFNDIRHGPITNCPIADSERVVLEYLAASEASAGRKHLELRFGRANVLKLVALYNEEQANKQWLNRSTTECPGCQCRVEKSLGCNHVRIVWLLR